MLQKENNLVVDKEIATKVQEKRKSYKKWLKVKTKEAKKEYLEKKRCVKKIVANAKNKESKKLTTDLVKEESLHNVYQITKNNRMEKKKIMDIPCLKGKDGQLKVKLADNLKELEEYANNLLNMENKWNGKLINAHVE